MSKKEADPIEETRKRQAEIVAEQEAAQSVRPTPTQDEADRAKLGQDVEFEAPEEKAADGEKPGAAYKTRETKAG